MKEELIFAFSAVEYQYNPPSKEHPDYYARLADAALEVLADRPIPKMKVTDEMIDVALTAYFPREGYLEDSPAFNYKHEILWDENLRQSMKAALEAVLSMPVSEDKPELFCDCNLPGCLYCASDHKERVKEQPTDTQDNDGWIKHDGLDMPYPLSYQIEIEMRDGARIACQSKDCLWEHEGAKYDIIAYRIIDEPKAQECECKNPKPGQYTRVKGAWPDYECAMCGDKILKKECDHSEENTIIILDDNKTHIKCNVCYKAWEYKGKLVTATTFKEPKKQTLWDTWVKKYPVMESSKQNDARIADMKFISDWMEQNK